MYNGVSGRSGRTTADAVCPIRALDLRRALTLGGAVLLAAAPQVSSAQTYQYSVTTNTTLNSVVAPPSGFTQTDYAIGNGSTLTLAPGSNPNSTVYLMTLSGSGSFVNNANITTSGAAIAHDGNNFSYPLISVTNNGTIQSAVGSGYYAVTVQSYGLGALSNTGSITATDGGGVYASLESVTNSGRIVADGTAVSGFDSVVTNSGTIQSTGGVGFYGSGNEGTPAYNTGNISGQTIGVQLAGYTMTNSGTISSPGMAVSVDPYGTLINKPGGTINGNVGAALYGYTFIADVVNGGTINGNINFGTDPSTDGARNAYAGQAGSVLNGSLFLGTGTVTNAGLISGGTTSVTFSGFGPSTLTLQTGSTLIGDAIGSTSTAPFNSATNALVLQGTGVANNNFLHFNTLDSQGPGTWSLGGTSSIGATTVSGGILNITGELTSSFTVISGATLQGTSNSLIGGITDNGTVVFDQASAGTFSSAIGGTGSVEITGGGTLTLTNVDTYSGKTVIGQSWLVLSGSGSISNSAEVMDNGGFSIAGTSAGTSIQSLSGSGLVELGDRTLTITNGATSFSGTIEGNGGLIMDGGTQILAGTNTYSGPTVINGGVLDVNGSVTNSTITLNGGTLKGNGKVASLQLASGSTIAPGNSIGTLNVAGDITFSPGSVYQVETNVSGQSDLIVAGGKANLGGAMVEVVPQVGTYLPVTTYQIVNASGGVTGTFAGVTSDAANLTPSLQYSANGVGLQLIRNDLQFASYGNTRDQQAVGAAVSAGGVTTPLYVSLAMTALAPSAVPAALAALSGDIHAGMRSALSSDDRVIRQTILDHLADAHEDGVVAWASAFDSWHTFDGGADASKMSDAASGFTFGADIDAIAGLRVGVAGSFLSNRLALSDRTGTMRDHATHLTAYASWAPARLSLRGGADFGWGRSASARAVQFESISENDVGNRSHNTMQLFSEAAYRFDLGGKGHMSPYVDLAWDDIAQDAFRETGGTLSALSGASHSDSTTSSVVGARFDTTLHMDGFALEPTAALGWQHAYGPLRQVQAFTFEATSQSFGASGPPLAAEALLGHTGLEVNFAGHGSLAFAYDGLYAGRERSHTVRLRMGWRF